MPDDPRPRWWDLAPWALLLLGHALAAAGASSFEHLSELGDQLRRIESGAGWGLLPMGPGGGASGGSGTWVALASLPWRLGAPPEGLAALALALDAAALATWTSLARRAWGPSIALASALLLAADPTTERYLAENSAVLPALLAPALPGWVLLSRRGPSAASVSLATLLAAATSLAAGALAPAAALGLLALRQRRFDLVAAAAAAGLGLFPVLSGVASEVEQAARAPGALTLRGAVLAMAWPGLLLWAVAAARARSWLAAPVGRWWAAAALGFALGPAAPYLGCDPFHAAVGVPAFALLGARGAEALGLGPRGLAVGLAAVVLAGGAARVAPLEAARSCPPGLAADLVDAAGDLLPSSGEVVFHGHYAHCLDGWWVWSGLHRGEGRRHVVLSTPAVLPDGRDVLGLRAAAASPAPPAVDTPTRLQWPPGEGRLFVELAPGARVAAHAGGDRLADAPCGPCATAGHPAVTFRRRPDEPLALQIEGARDWALESAAALPP